MRIRPVNKLVKWISGIILGDITGISLCPFGIYINPSAPKETLNHEKIHWRQQVEMLVIPFYVWYLIEFFLRRIRKNKRNAYLSISFEREAYANQDDMEYLSNRKPFSWTRYL